ncbi:poly(ethylene terephthalate) hydrolase family protein [Marinirhabdus gelatinilytica]|uniref:Putative secreted protein (Por secretion system target) n=1 Tax=Marinirhabdus gelatinilytica TaxID=1703343 RepID=A0A370QIR1_9FLAO|nr:T9SS type A sorting domain-containing protein [Marinirhabdus gelatinilytica]RDK88247.1 putative secreted protein (Por secretion system target) [Marinirhabdus gelatinilytica]
MKKYYTIILLFVALLSANHSFAQCEDVTVASLTNPGPLNVATLTEADGIRNGPDYMGATIYYPTDGTPPYSSIAIVPGFTATPASVEEWGPFYASHGIVTIIIGTNSPFDFPEERALALLDALETLREENIRASSPLEGDLDLDKFAVSGWSMGGGGAQRAAVLDNTIKGVVALCPFLFDPSVNHQSPVLLFSGEDDPTAPPAQHATLHYENTPETTDKLLFEVAGGNHSVANTPTGANGLVGQIALSWLRLHVLEDDCYCPLLTEELLDNPSEASDIRTNIECAPILNVQEHTIATSIYPNPTQNRVTVAIENNVYFEVYSTLGQLLKKGSLTGTTKQIDLTDLVQGIYYIRINGETIKILKN